MGCFLDKRYGTFNRYQMLSSSPDSPAVMSYQGCYKDDPSNRDLGAGPVLSGSLTPQKCMDKCKAHGSAYKYAGLQVSWLQQVHILS